MCLVTGVCVPVETCPAVHESSSLHGHVNIVQREVEGVGEGNTHKHLLLHLRQPAHLKNREEEEKDEDEIR